MTKIGSNAQFSSAGLGITYVGDYAYAYSGTVEVTGTTNPVTMLSFQTGKELIKAVVQFHYLEAGGNDLNFFVNINGIRVASQSIGGAKEYYHSPLILIIPPLSLVECSGLNIDAATARDSSVTFSGRVY